MISNNIAAGMLLLSAWGLGACSDKVPGQPVEPTPDPYQPVSSRAAPEWDSLLYRHQGWFGGDGIFAVPADGAEFRSATDSTLSWFFFSDSVIADSVGSSIQRSDFTMVHNCVATLEGKFPDPARFRFHIPRDSAGHPQSLFVPNTNHTRPGDYYWLGDGFVNVALDSTLYLFAYPVRDTVIPGSFFEFEQTGVNLIAIPKGSRPPFPDQRQLETPFFFPLENGSKVTMGSAILVNTEWAGAPHPDGYIYILGVGGQQQGLVVARVLPEDFEAFDRWQFSRGTDWTNDPLQASPVARHVSNEMSLSPTADGRYALVYQYFGLEQEVAVQLARSPAGPYLPTRKVWHCREWEADLDYFAYNAKAFPHFSRPGELLVSYNVNSFDFWQDILKDPRLCRPRFFRVKI